MHECMQILHILPHVPSHILLASRENACTSEERKDCCVWLVDSGRSETSLRVMGDSGRCETSLRVMGDSRRSETSLE
jgi:hypothetical protein